MKTLKTYEAFKPKPKQEKIQLDLNGPDGNAFQIIALAKSLARKLDYPKEDIDQLSKDMMMADYKHLVLVFEDHFGDFVDIYGFEKYDED